uniref:Mitochondrial transcription termination factor n=1 Tax=Tetraselmis sp. GSL018 TaxID=582737 RepID=A0A061RBW6_9CHLO|mmetsp:Transcript_11025/g.26145  ORF Transcript_11025/g.26145 Transcript_11025/m.26145 type:complete len:250 (-) Transcript_11025:185-934(-)
MAARLVFGIDGRCCGFTKGNICRSSRSAYRPEGRSDSRNYVNFARCIESPRYMCGFSVSTVTQLRAQAKKGDAEAVDILRTAVTGQDTQVDPAVTAMVNYLQGLGIQNRAELMQVVDICTNPHSLYRVAMPGPQASTRGTPNQLARKLSVDEDLQPVVDVLRDFGLEREDIVKVILAHPPVLCYGEERIRKLLAYLEEVGVPKPVGKILVKRPSLAGLKADENLKKIVGYFVYRGYSSEEIVRLLETSI